MLKAYWNQQDFYTFFHICTEKGLRVPLFPKTSELSQSPLIARVGGYAEVWLLP